MFFQSMFFQSPFVPSLFFASIFFQSLLFVHAPSPPIAPSPMLRSLLRARLFSSATIATIGLSTAGACTVFALLNAVLLRPLPYAHPDRLVGMWHTLPGVDVPVAKQSIGTYTLYRESSRSFESMGLFLALPLTITYPNSDLTP